MKYLIFDDFKEGMKVTISINCRNKDVIIYDAKLHFENTEDGNWFVCQNKCDGIDCRDKLGYRYSWALYDQDNLDYFIKEGVIKDFYPAFTLKDKIKILKKELCK